MPEIDAFTMVKSPRAMMPCNCWASCKREGSFVAASDSSNSFTKEY